MHKVDIVIPCYNYGHFLDECVSAVVGQSYTDFKVLLIDNASTDDTQKRAEQWVANDDRINYELNEHNLGFHGSLRKAMSMTEAEYVVILPVDDLWGADYLKETVSALDDHSEVAMAYTRWRQFRDEGSRRMFSQAMFIPHRESGVVNDRELLIGYNWVPLSFGLFRRVCFNEVGGIRDDLSQLGDYELWLRMSAKWLFFFCDNLQGLIRSHESNWSIELIGSGKAADEYLRIDDQIYAHPTVWPAHTRFLAKARQINRLTGIGIVEISRLMLEESGAIHRDLILPCKNAFKVAVAELVLANIETGKDEGLFGKHNDGIRLLNEVLDEDSNHDLALKYYNQYRHSNEISSPYNVWLHKHSLQEIDGELFAERMVLKWKVHPEFHFVMAMGSKEQNVLANTLDSIAGQMYWKWRISILADFPCPDPKYLEQEKLEWIEGSAEDFQERSDRLVAESSADWVSIITPGVRFSPQFLIKCADYINIFPHWHLIYTDEDLVDEEGHYYGHKFKPDFNLDMLRSMPYFGNFLLRRDTFVEAGGYSRIGGAETYDLALRILDTAGEAAIGHIADVLVHMPDGSGANHDVISEQQALIDHLHRNGVRGNVVGGYKSGTYRVVYQHAEEPLVSIVIPNRDKLEFIQPCIESLFGKTDYPNFEVLLVDNQSSDPDVLEFYEEAKAQYGKRLSILAYPDEFNFSAINNLAANHAEGEYLLLLNNDTQIVQAEWLSRMMAYGQRPEVGVVGARLVYPETGKLQHAGVVLGISNAADHPFNKVLAIGEPGYMNRALIDQNYSAVTAACMLIRKLVYQRVGGMDEERLCVLFNDVDMCLKVGQAGYKIVWTPYATVVHYGSASIKNEIENPMKAAIGAERAKKERGAMLERWLPKLANDPAYNRNLSLVRTDYSVESTIVIDWDTNFHDRPRILGVPLAGGVGEYRMISPFRAMSNAGMAQTNTVMAPKLFQMRLLTPVELERAKPDSLVLHTTIDNFSLEVMELYKQYNSDVFRVFGLDDLVTQTPRKSAFYKYAFKDAKPRMRKALSLSDRLIVTTQPLADLCKGMIDDIRIIPNRLERAKWGGVSSLRAQGNKPRVGWAGAQQHDGDLELIHEVVKATAHEVDWVFFGMCPAELRPHVREFHDFVLSFEEYPAKLASLNLDLAVAPLEIHPFNEAKSNLRLLEYGIMGWPVVCTDISSYHGAPVKRVPNQTSAWIEAIRERIHDLDAAHKEGDQLRQWVLDHYILEDHLDEWMAALLRS